jgi:hypothetical protein
MILELYVMCIGCAALIGIVIVLTTDHPLEHHYGSTPEPEIQRDIDGNVIHEGGRFENLRYNARAFQLLNEVLNENPTTNGAAGVIHAQYYEPRNSDVSQPKIVFSNDEYVKKDELKLQNDDSNDINVEYHRQKMYKGNIPRVGGETIDGETTTRMLHWVADDINRDFLKSFNWYGSLERERAAHEMIYLRMRYEQLLRTAYTTTGAEVASESVPPRYQQSNTTFLEMYNIISRMQRLKMLYGIDYEIDEHRI